MSWLSGHRLVLAIAVGLIWFAQFTISGYLHAWGQSLYQQYKSTTHDKE
ncbi:hypothetical protein [Scytonema sp. PCC 10023]